MKKFFNSLIVLCALMVICAGNAMAAFELPVIVTTGIEAAGTAVAALIAVAVVIGVVFRLLKKA